MSVWKLIARNWLQTNGRYSDTYTNTRIMQNALPKLHNALCLSGLSHANELEMMEPSQADGNLPLAWPWNISDLSNIIDAAKVKKREKCGVKSKDGGCARVIPVTCVACKNVAVFIYLCISFLAGSFAALLQRRWRRLCPSWAHLFGGANRVRCSVKWNYPCSRHWLQSNLEEIIGSDWKLLLKTVWRSYPQTFGTNLLCRNADMYGPEQDCFEPIYLIIQIYFTYTTLI